jgi:hypothetical protein
VKHTRLIGLSLGLRQVITTPIPTSALQAAALASLLWQPGSTCIGREKGRAFWKTLHHDVMKKVPWPLEQTPTPMSGAAFGTMAAMGPVTLDSVASYAPLRRPVSWSPRLH